MYPKIPITILGENHKLELVATATLGIGLDHAKYLPGLCYYRHILEVKSSNEADKIIQSSKSFLKPEKRGSKWLCDLREIDVDKIIEKDKDAVSDTQEILFVIESWGQMPAKDILLKSLDALSENLIEFEKAIK